MEDRRRLIPDPIAQTIREAVAAARGREVVFALSIGEGGVAETARVVARGRPEVVPAPMGRLEHGDLVVHNHPDGNLEPSRADISVAGELAGVGVGSAIVDNDVEHMYVIVEPTTVPPVRPLDVDALAEVLEPDGPLGTVQEGYEYRPAQVDMLRSVARALNNDVPALLEAGTGVGKSFAYLVPAFAWAAQNQERVVVATATINLQQQLIEKDVPAVKDMLGSEVKAALVKGRGNYLCRIRLEEAVEEDLLFQEPDDELLMIRDWAATSATGAKDDLSFLPKDDVWTRVNSDPDACAASRCRKRDDCFLLKARKSAASAGILIANHHLLFSDLAIRMGGVGYETTAILPPFRRLIFDEAHNVERSATSYFSQTLSKFAVGKALGRLRRSRRGRTLGLLVQLSRLVGNFATPKAVSGGKPSRGLEKTVELIDGARSYADALDGACLAFLGTETALRVAPAGRDAAGRGARMLTAEAVGALSDVNQSLLDIAMTVADVFDDLDEAQLELPVVLELRPVVRRLEAMASLCEAFLRYSEHGDEEGEAKVYWVERVSTSAGEAYCRLTVSPLEIGEVMNEAVLEPYPTVVFTSATLRVAESFSYFESRVGLGVGAGGRRGPESSEGERIEESFPSPFDYKQRVLLAIPSDAPLPESPDYQPFLSRFVGDLLVLSEGRALVLFTSYRMLRETYEAVRPRLDEIGVSTLRQGDDDRGRLLLRFRTDLASVLFATDSFWEGVDTPGDALSLVVMCRLPFRVPTHPIYLARMEAIEARGGNAFMELSLPEAVMRLKQGFGRLMRRGSDKGVVTITDSRVLQKRYGSLFLASLPETQTSFAEAHRLLDDIEAFLY